VVILRSVPQKHLDKNYGQRYSKANTRSRDDHIRVVSLVNIKKPYQGLGVERHPFEDREFNWKDIIIE